MIIGEIRPWEVGPLCYVLQTKEFGEELRRRALEPAGSPVRRVGNKQEIITKKFKVVIYDDRRLPAGF